MKIRANLDPGSMYLFQIDCGDGERIAFNHAQEEADAGGAAEGKGGGREEGKEGGDRANT